MKKIRYLIVTLLLVLLAAGTVPALSAFAQDSPPVRVAVLDYPNYLMMQDDGSVYGYAYEYLSDIQKLTGWKYEYIEMSFAEAMDALTAGRIDLLPGNQYLDSRAELWDYSERSTGEGGTLLCNLPDNIEYAYNDYSAYGGMRIGALKGSARIAQTRQVLSKYDVEAVFVEYDTDAKAKAALKRGEIDAVLMSAIRCESDYKILARISSTPLYFCTSKLRPELKTELDAAVDTIHLESPYYEQELDHKYYGDIMVQSSLSKDELSYVASSKSVRIAVSTDMTPLAYYNEKEQSFYGIIPDSLSLISKYTGLRFELVPRGSEQTSSRQLKDGEIQMLDFVICDASLISPLDLRHNSAYFESGVSLITKSSGIRNADTSGTMILKNGYPDLVWVAKNHGYSHLQYADSFADCLKAVRSGDALYTLVPSNSVSYMLAHTYYASLTSYAFPDSSYDFGFGVSSSADPRLLSVMNKAISSISDKQRTNILIKNLNDAAGSEITLRDFIADHQSEFLFYVIAISLTVLLVVNLNAKRIVRLNARLQAEAARADESSAAKSEFLSRMSHDMRTPLNAVLGFTALARGAENLPEVVEDYLEKISSSGNYLLGLINDVLDMAKIESGKVEFYEESVDLPKLLADISYVFRAQAAEKGISLVSDFSALHETWVVLDALRLRQIFANLLSNAIKFSSGGTEIRWTLMSAPDGADRIRITSVVSDQGCGMSEQFLPRFFEPFEQGSASHSVSGTGLGLPIVKSLVTLMGGTVSVESALGVGTTFTIELDLARGVAQAAEPVLSDGSIAALRGKRILLCEDNRINTLVAVRLLENAGCIIDCAENGKEGLEKFEQSPPNYYSAVLMDIRMPEMNGLEATRALRMLDRADAKTVPIIAMSANAFEEDVRMSLDAGMNMHLSKPIEPQTLYSALARHIHTAGK